MIANTFQNQLLCAMAPDDRGLLVPHLERTSQQPKQTLVVAGAPIEHVYFLEDGVASIVATLASSKKTEVGIFGRDGLSGIEVLLGTDRSPHQTFMQISGQWAYRIATGKLLDAVSKSDQLRNLLLRYVNAFLVQTARSSVSNAHDKIETRLARWLLMCHDRVDGDRIALTHEFMAMMIAAQRTGVTQTLHIIEGRGAIRSTRGALAIRDRGMLEEIAGDSYGPPEEEYSRMISPFGKTIAPPPPA